MLIISRLGWGGGGGGGVNSRQGVTGGMVLPLGSCSWTGGGCEVPTDKSGRASHLAVGQTRRGSQGQELGPSVLSIFLPGGGGDCSHGMCSRP